MGSKELSLTWDDHHGTLVGVFEKLLESNTLVDCTIAAEGQYLKAHKVVLSACSPYFELLFTQESEKNPILVLKDIKFQDLRSMIDFVYRGKVKIAEDRLEDFVAAAESLQIKGLGSGQKKNDSKGKKIETLSAQKRGGSTSTVPHKRIRKRRVSNNEKNTNTLSSVIDLHHESSSSESFPRNENSVDVPVSLPRMVSDSQTKASSDTFVQDVSDQEETNYGRAEPSTSYEPHVQSSLLTETQQILASCETIVKTEPEPIAEVFLPETECFIDAKNEISVEELQLFDSEHGKGIVMADNMCPQSEQNASQFSDFSASHDAAGMKSSELVQMAGPSSAKDKSTTKTPSSLTTNKHTASRINEIDPGKLLMLLFHEHGEEDVDVESPEVPASESELPLELASPPSIPALASSSAPQPTSAQEPAPAPTPASLEGNEADLQDDVPSTTQVAEITKYIDVERWVKGNTTYPDLYHTLTSGQYTDVDRRHLVQIVVTEMCKEWGNEYPSSKYKEEVAKALVAVFPVLKSRVPGRSHESYYDNKTGEGFLEYRLKTIRIHLSASKKRRSSSRTSLATKGPKCRKKIPETLGDLLPEEDLKELISEMKNRKESSRNKAIIRELLRLTRPNRTEEIRDKSLSVEALFNKYPHLKSFDGEMIDEEFRALYESHDVFRDRFPAYFTERIIRHCEATAPGLLWPLRDVETNLRALLLLPELLPPPNHSMSGRGQKKSQTRPQTKVGQVKRANIPHPLLLRFIRENEDLSTSNALLNANEKQPFLVCATSSGQMKGPFFIVLDPIVFSVGSNGIAAFDRLFKLYYLLDMEYATPLKNFFNFMEACVYGGLASPKSSSDNFLTQLALVQLKPDTTESESERRSSSELRTLTQSASEM